MWTNTNDSIACKTTFSISELKLWLSVWFYQSLKSSILYCFSLLRFVGVCFCTILLRSQHASPVEVWTFSCCNTLILLFISHVVGDQLLCLEFLFCFMTQFLPSINCQTGGLTFDCGILCYTEEVMLDSVSARCSNHDPSTSVNDTWYEVFVLICTSYRAFMCFVAEESFSW